MDGLFIAVEGPNGVGKSTTVNRLASRLRGLGMAAHPTTEPTDTPLGRLIRTSESTLTGRAMALAVAADRTQHVDKEVEPALAAGQGRPPALDQVSIPGRVAVAVLDTDPRTWFLSVYVPSRDRGADKTTRKEMFVGSLLKLLAELPAGPHDHLVIGGDYNVIPADHDPLHPGFLPFEFGLLDTLHARGFVDAHRHCAPGVQAYSWIGRTGAGYRYDYFHVGSALSGRIQACEYLHEPRELGLTDHAAVRLDLDIRAVRLSCRNPAEPDAISLF
ncbi:hypothetical protein Acor_21520 [Acrocarpospora corrugata]|uniref:Thymidylate kinase-like domain-containing protein n=1 Tax=Acrocarpospora corrugata TaxID=35763 RepID=A0A5M3VV72_9ACTN|nr:hypothetical protein [Acrocarpospora corrugata]GES00089.1 hypothetical protein Acor_21520 [Acrocarpospora corrugata]